MPEVTHGMDVAAVEDLGRRIQGQHVEQMRNVIRQIDAAVSGTGSSWSGPDAARFRSWWPEKRARMEGIANDLHGFAQSALNNATEQRGASGAGGVLAGTGGVVIATAATIGLANATPTGTAPTGTAPTGGVLPGSDRSWEQVSSAYQANYRSYGLWADGAPGGENQYQCVSWAWFRMRELGYTGGQFSANGKGVATGLGGTTDTMPLPGAVLSRDSGNPWGHVMIAEKVETGADGTTRVTVSEMNVGGDALHGTPQEYQANRILERRPDGRWYEYGKPSSITVANPAYGTPRI